MGLLDRLFSNSKDTQATKTSNTNETYKKARSAERIVDLVSKIKKINSFDSSLWNLSNISIYELRKRSLVELQNLESTLENRYSELSNQNKTPNQQKEQYEEAKWTGENTTDRAQNDGFYL